MKGAILNAFYFIMVRVNNNRLHDFFLIYLLESCGIMR